MAKDEGKEEQIDDSGGFDVDEALNRLEDINARLAGDEMALSESIGLYKEGVQLADQCRKHLEGVEQELQIVNE